MPSWIQPIARVLPLTPMNITLRSIICYGEGLGDNLMQLGIMVIWFVFGLVISSRFFKWE
jgi:ABC-2 type transport system permease protein